MFLYSDSQAPLLYRFSNVLGLLATAGRRRTQRCHLILSIPSVDSGVLRWLIIQARRSSDWRRGKSRRRHQRRRAAQSRMLVQSDISDFGLGRVRRKGAFGQTDPDRGFDQVPGRDYFATDVYARRVYGVDDRGQPESQVARRSFERGDRFRVSGPRPDDQIFDREGRDLRRDWFRLAQVPPEVARERRQVGDVSLPAACRAAGAARAVYAQRDVAELSRDVVMTPQHLTVDDDAHADAVRDADENQVAHGRRVLARRPHLSQRACLA